MKPALGRSTDASEIGRINRLVTLRFSIHRYYRDLWFIVRKTLDYGSGNGVVARRMDSFLNLVTCVDVGHGLTFSHEYDVVTCFDVLEHCDDPHKELLTMHSALADNGYLILTVPNRWWLFETHASRPWNRLVGFNWGPWRHWLRRKVGRNVPCYTKREIRDLIEAAGFDIVDIGYQVAPLDNAPWLRKLVWNWHTTKIPFFAVDIYVVAVKQ